jgi:hypothetical protein
MYYFQTNIYFNITQDEIKKYTFFKKRFLYLLGCHNIQKIVKFLCNNDIVEVLKVHHFKKSIL